MKIATQTSYLCATLGMEQGIRLLKEVGYDGMDLSLFAMTKDDSPFNADNYREYAAELKVIADDCGIAFTQAHAPFSFRWEDEEVYRNIACPRVERSIEIAALVGAKTIIVHPIHHQLYAGHEEEMHALNIAYYSTLIPLCETYGIKVAVENMWQRDPIRKYITHDVCSRSVLHAAMVDELNAISPCFTACLDVGHSVLIGEEPADAIRTLGHRLGALHLHDNNYIADQHTIPGLGRIDWTALTAALKEIGYTGEFTYEADAFLKGFTPDLLPTAAKFMADVARYWAKKCE